MSAINATERQIQASLTCGKCGSTAVVCDDAFNHTMTQRVFSLKCLICGNRQEEGIPCRWPFFSEENGTTGVEMKTVDTIEVNPLQSRAPRVAATHKSRQHKKRTKKSASKIVRSILSG